MKQTPVTTVLGLEQLASHVGVAREAVRLWLETYEIVTGKALPRGERRARLAPLEVADLLKRAVPLTRETDLPRDEAIRAELHSPPPGGGLEEALVKGLSEALDKRLEPLLVNLEHEAAGHLEALQARLDERVIRHLQQITKRQDAQVSGLKRQLSNVSDEARSAVETNLNTLNLRLTKGTESVDRTARRFELAEQELVQIAQQLDASTAGAREATLGLRAALRDLEVAQRNLRGDRTALARVVAVGAGVGGIVGVGTLALAHRLIAQALQQGAVSTSALLIGLVLALAMGVTTAVKLLR